jgi:hypothetical protein
MIILKLANLKSMPIASEGPSTLVPDLDGAIFGGRNDDRRDFDFPFFRIPDRSPDLDVRHLGNVHAQGLDGAARRVEDTDGSILAAVRDNLR